MNDSVTNQMDIFSVYAWTGRFVFYKRSQMLYNVRFIKLFAPMHVLLRILVTFVSLKIVNKDTYNRELVCIDFFAHSFRI